MKAKQWSPAGFFSLTLAIVKFSIALSIIAIVSLQAPVFATGKEIELPKSDAPIGEEEAPPPPTHKQAPAKSKEAPAPPNHEDSAKHPQPSEADEENVLDNSETPEAKSDKLVDASEKNVAHAQGSGLIWFFAIFTLLLVAIFVFT